MSNTVQPVPEDQLSPREVINKILDVKNALLRNWVFLILCPAIGFGIGYAMDAYLKTPSQYTADVVFNLGGSGSGGGGMGDVAGLLGLGNAPDANISTGDNFFYFVRSRPVIERNLMKEVNIRGQKVILANFYIDSSGIKDKEWKDQPDYQNFHFTSRRLDSLDMKTRVALNQIVIKVTAVTEIGPLERKSSFTKISTMMENETLAALWVTTLLKTVEEMYTENQTQKSRKALRMYQNRADSLGRVLGRTEYSLAKEMDMTTLVLAPEAKVSTNKMERKSNFVMQLYQESLANVERMKSSLVREAPLFTEIEGVKIPLDVKSEDQKRAKIGALTGLFVALVLTYLRAIFSSASKPSKD